jgi:hypothetical protein
MNQENSANIVHSVIHQYEGEKYCASLNSVFMDIKIKDRTYKLIRLFDDQYYLLRKHSVSIEDNINDLMMYSSIGDECIYPSLSKMYVVLKKRFGESGDCHDSWKGAFSFPFLLYFEKDGKHFNYLLNICNFRSYIEFRLSKLLGAEDENLRKDIYHKPFEELSKGDISGLTGYLIGFCTGFFESYSEKYHDQFFFKTVESNLIIFGYKDGNFFDDNYHSEEEFSQAIEELTEIQKQQP